jgi:SIR2-like domain
MSETFNPLPEIPPEIENAAQSGELVVFVGAGISRLIKCPSWDGLAERVLEQLVPAGIDYYQLSQIKKIADPKKQLSIAKIVAEKKAVRINYESIFQVKLEPGNVYSYLNSFNSSFVTTNYEKFLAPESRKAEPEEKWRFYKREHLLRVNLDQNGNVVHIHGCLDDPDNMVITTKDYLDHYSSKELQDFLRYLFEKKTILFLGYGLEEIEVLEYIHRRGEATAGQKEERIRRYILQGFFNAEMALYRLLKDYYLKSFGTDLIGFPKDEKNYIQQVEILALWSKRLQFRGVALTDEVSAIEEEIGG